MSCCDWQLGIAFSAVSKPGERRSQEAVKQLNLPDRIYHLAEAPNWPLIQRDGLLCANRLVDAASLDTASRKRLQLEQRMVHTVLPNGVRIRDQRPMPPAALEKCLCGMSPTDWYAIVNARVFFWIDPDRLNRQRAACSSRPQVVIAVDTAALVAAHHEHVALTPINTGNARRKPARRGAATFVPYAQWTRSGWASEAAALDTPLRKHSHQPVELTVVDAVSDIMRFVVDVVALPAGQALVTNATGAAIVSTVVDASADLARVNRLAARREYNRATKKGTKPVTSGEQ